MNDQNDTCSECGYEPEFQQVEDTAEGLKEFFSCHCGAKHFYVDHVDNDGYYDDFWV